MTQFRMRFIERQACISFLPEGARVNDRSDGKVVVWARSFAGGDTRHIRCGGYCSNVRQPHMPLVRKVVDITYLVGALGSFEIAVAALVADSPRRTAFFALIAAIVAFSVCGLQMLVGATSSDRVSLGRVSSLAARPCRLCLPVSELRAGGGWPLLDVLCQGWDFMVALSLGFLVTLWEARFRATPQKPWLPVNLQPFPASN
jgi:hypothetical protein